MKGKKVGFYFSASWCPPCRRFTPTLVELYNEFSSKDFEIVFVSRDKDEDSFNDYFSKMPWLAIPFSDSDTRNNLNELFKGRGIPHLVILVRMRKLPLQMEQRLSVSMELKHTLSHQKKSNNWKTKKRKLRRINHWGLFWSTSHVTSLYLQMESK